MTRHERPRTARSSPPRSPISRRETSADPESARSRHSPRDPGTEASSSTLLAGASSLTATEYRALLAVNSGARTVREVAEIVERAVSTTHRALSWLRRLDLVAWDTGKDGTLRPAVRVVSGPWAE